MSQPLIIVTPSAETPGLFEIEFPEQGVKLANYNPDDPWVSSLDTVYGINDTHGNRLASFQEITALCRTCAEMRGASLAASRQTREADPVPEELVRDWAEFRKKWLSSQLPAGWPYTPKETVCFGESQAPEQIHPAVRWLDEPSDSSAQAPPKASRSPYLGGGSYSFSSQKFEVSWRVLPTGPEESSESFDDGLLNLATVLENSAKHLRESLLSK